MLLTSPRVRRSLSAKLFDQQNERAPWLQIPGFVANNYFAYAVPANHLTSLLDELFSKGQVRGFLPLVHVLPSSYVLSFHSMSTSSPRISQ
jgi:hypothetical protein